jgi:hypothetical protein
MKILVALSIALLSCRLLGQTARPELSGAQVEKTVVAALSFEQGNLDSLKRAQATSLPRVGTSS